MVWLTRYDDMKVCKWRLVKSEQHFHSDFWYCKALKKDWRSLDGRREIPKQEVSNATLDLPMSTLWFHPSFFLATGWADNPGTFCCWSLRGEFVAQKWRSFDRCSGGQVSKTAGLHACSVHHILSFVHPGRHHALPCQGRKRKNREKESQNAAGFCIFCPLQILKKDFPVSTHQPRSVCVGKCTFSLRWMQIVCLKICTACIQRNEPAVLVSFRTGKTCWFDSGCIGGMTTDVWCFMTDVTDLCHVTVCHVFCGEALSGASHFSYWLSNMIYVHRLRCNANL